MPIGVMSAMREEIESLLPELEGARAEESGMRTYHSGRLWGAPAVLVFSRWGKVAAATTATHLITRLGADRVVFTGVAGAVAPGVRPGDVVVADRLVQHDMDARPLFERHEIPLLGVREFRTDPTLRAAAAAAARDFLAQDLSASVPAEVLAEFHIRAPKVVKGEVASGDRFFADRAELDRLRQMLPRALCVEMEGAAVAQVCHEYGVPCAIVRTISDAADESAGEAFPRFVERVATAYSHGILRRMLDRGLRAP